MLGTTCQAKQYHIPEELSPDLNVIAKKIKVKCTLVQALRLCTGCTAHRGEQRYSSALSWPRH